MGPQTKMSNHQVLRRKLETTNVAAQVPVGQALAEVEQLAVERVVVGQQLHQVELLVQAVRTEQGLVIRTTSGSLEVHASNLHFSKCLSFAHLLSEEELKPAVLDAVVQSDIILVVGCKRTRIARKPPVQCRSTFREKLLLEMLLNEMTEQLLCVPLGRVAKNAEERLIGSCFVSLVAPEEVAVVAA